MKERALFATKIGVIATTVGSAVGLGNIWRFPYEAGEHGGSAFLIIYLLCVFLIGIPVICAEFIIGRSTHKNVKGAFNQLAKGTKWHMLSYLGILASLMILSFYSVVAGWTIEYLYLAINGTLTNPDINFAQQFNSFSASPIRSLGWTFLFLFLNFLILRRGVQEGIERISNILMPLLFIILIIFCINSLTLPKAEEGIKFLFSPDFSKIDSNVLIGAMGQAFFSLSLGLGGLLTYSSYFSDKVKLVRSATIIAMLDTTVAVLAGIIIFPAVFSYGASPASGPKLVFEILPSIFTTMAGGYVWAILFFLLLFFASITSTISMSEISIAFFSEEHKIPRRKANLITSLIAVIFGGLCALSFGVLNDVRLFGFTFFDLFDYVSSNILLPVGGIFFSIYAGWFASKDLVRNQLTNYGDVKVHTFNVIIFLMRFIAPVAIILIFLSGLKIINF